MTLYSQPADNPPPPPHRCCMEALFCQCDEKKKDFLSHCNEKLFQNNDLVSQNTEKRSQYFYLVTRNNNLVSQNSHGQNIDKVSHYIEKLGESLF